MQNGTRVLGSLSLMEWTLSTACALHDLHNALKWAMHSEFNDAQLMKEVFIAYASVRNGFDEIQQHLCLWLLQVTAFVSEDELPPAEELKEFWEALGVSEERVEHLGTTILWWDPVAKVLKASKVWSEGGDNVMEELTGAILVFLECKTFHEARWASARASRRSLWGR